MAGTMEIVVGGEIIFPVKDGKLVALPSDPQEAERYLEEMHGAGIVHGALLVRCREPTCKNKKHSRRRRGAKRQTPELRIPPRRNVRNRSSSSKIFSAARTLRRCVRSPSAGHHLGPDRIFASKASTFFWFSIWTLRSRSFTCSVIFPSTITFTCAGGGVSGRSAYVAPRQKGFNS